MIDANDKSINYKIIIIAKLKLSNVAVSSTHFYEYMNNLAGVRIGPIAPLNSLWWQNFKALKWN